MKKREKMKNKLNINQLINIYAVLMTTIYIKIFLSL